MVKEGKLVEYKGHTSFTIERPSVWAKHTPSCRQILPVANRIINKGIIIMGVQDNRLIYGLILSKVKHDHLVTNIVDTFDQTNQNASTLLWNQFLFMSNIWPQNWKRKKPTSQMKNTSRTCLEQQNFVGVITDKLHQSILVSSTNVESLN